MRVQGQARHGVHEEHLAEGGARPGASLQEDRRLHVHERERDKLGEAARPLLLLPQANEVARPAPRAFDRPEHDRCGRAETGAVGRVVHLEPLVRRHLVRADDPAYLVVEDLGRCPR